MRTLQNRYRKRQLNLVDRQSVIKTRRLYIVPFSKEYLTERYVSWLNNPEVVRYSEQRYKTHTLETCRTYMKSFVGSPHYFWAIVFKGTPPMHVGNITAYVDEHSRVADVGILIGETSVWGRGIGLEAWKSICDYLLYTKNMRKITAGTLSVNVAMIRIMQKAGMREDGRRIRQCLFEGGEVDVIYMALFQDEQHLCPTF